MPRLLPSPVPLLLLALLALQTGCREMETAEEASSPDRREFQVTGVLQEIRDDGNVLIIDHEEIPGYMRAMIMPFKVADQASTEGLTPGDQLEFDYIVEEYSSWIEELEATGHRFPLTPEPESVLPEGVELLTVGDQVPDYEFLDQTGRRVSLSDFSGRPLAFTFVFTRCPVPEYCPAMMHKFVSLDQTMREDPEAPADWHLLTISFDHEHDTPEVMKAYGEAFGHQPGHWSLLTNDTCCPIRELAANVGLKYGETQGSLQHNLRTVVVDGDRRIRRLFVDESWAVSDLVAAIKEAAKPSNQSSLRSGDGNDLDPLSDT